MRTQNGFISFKFIAFLAFLFAMGVVVQHFFDPIGAYLKSKDKQRVNDLSVIQQGLESYYKFQGSYPGASDDFKIIGFKAKPVEWGDSWSPYISQLPVDPDSNKKYVYTSDATRQSYGLYTNLDYPENFPKTCFLFECTRIPKGVCGVNGTVDCNYGITSNNISP